MKTKSSPHAHGAEECAGLEATRSALLRRTPKPDALDLRSDEVLISTARKSFIVTSAELSAALQKSHDKEFRIVVTPRLGHDRWWFDAFLQRMANVCTLVLNMTVEKRKPHDSQVSNPGRLQ
jgi:hypothetical protein